MQIQMVTFSAVKDGNAPGEWQDGACGGVAADGRWGRFVVLDGATTAYDPVRWVDQLVRSFAPPAGGAVPPPWPASMISISSVTVPGMIRPCAGYALRTRFGARCCGM